MSRFLIWSTPFLVIATPAVAQQAAVEPALAPAVQTAPAPPAQPAATSAAKPKKICRRSITTGRRIATSRCYTAAQWADYDRTQNEAARELIADVTGAGGRSDLKSSSSGGLSTAPIFGLGSQ